MHSVELLDQLAPLITDQVPALVSVYNVSTGRYLYVNNAVVSFLGYSRREFMKGGISFTLSLIHPDDLRRILGEGPDIAQSMQSAAGRRTLLSRFSTYEYRIRHKNGSWKWLHTDNTLFASLPQAGQEVIPDSALNISVDITERKAQELRARQELLESEARYKTFLSHSTEGIWRFELEKPMSVSLTTRGQINHLYKYAYLAEGNDALAQMYGYHEAQDIIGARLNDFLPRSNVKNVRYLETFIASEYKLPTGQTYELDRTGRTRVFQNNLVGIIENGKLVRAWGTQRDVTTEKLLQDRLELLETVNQRLVVSLDENIALQEIAKLLVPQFADYCRIVTVDEAGRITEMTANHRDPKQVTLIHDLYDSYRNAATTTHGIPALLKTGKPEIIPVINDEVLRAFNADEKVMQLVKQIGLKSYMGFPLIARGKIIGAITFSSVQKNRYYTLEDQKFAQILVYRISLTIDNFKLYEEAQKAISIRDDFISIASHELKTPLTSLKINAQLLQKLAKPGERAMSVSQKVDGQVSRLTNLVEDLLDIGKIQTGKLDFKYEPFDLNAFVRETVEATLDPTDTHKVSIEGTIPHPVKGDKSRIEQVLVNLLSNAAKYSPNAKKVVIRLGEADGMAIVKVKDYGIGIEKQHLDRVFERFYRVYGSSQNTFPGLGIGLFISNEIVRRHGGTMAVKSKKDSGSTFSFTLPFAE